MGLLEDTWEWFEKTIFNPHGINAVIAHIQKIKTLDELETYWSSLPETQRRYGVVDAEYRSRRLKLQGVSYDPVAGFIEGQLDKWVTFVQGYMNTTPDNAQKNLAEISAKCVEIFGASALIDMTLGAIPTTTEGEVSSRNTKELLRWLGFGAVIAAVAHDPVKIGILRPYQDSLEQTFRNRRPSDVAIFQAYRTRELYGVNAAAIIASSKYQMFAATRDAAKGDVPLEALAVPYAAEIEEVNDAILWQELSRYGYSDEYIASLSRSATITPRFNDLMQLARQGLIPTRDATAEDALPADLQAKWEGKISDFALYSLWGAGYDKLTMGPILDSLMETNRISTYGGFRSMIEPAYREGIISAEDLTAYWNKIGVPADVQAWVMPRLTAQRVKYLAAQTKAAKAGGKELTRSDILKALSFGLITEEAARQKLTDMLYDEYEVDLIMQLQACTASTAAAAKCKHLSLSDYELAFKNGILSKQQVLDRMKGEYCDADIAIEDELLDLEALTAGATAAEKDLTVSQLSSAYVEDFITLDKFKASLVAIGYDEAEISILVQLADIKTSIQTGKSKKEKNEKIIAAEKDLTLAQLTAAYVNDLTTEASYISDVGSLGYDAAESATLLQLAKIKKKLPSIEGRKRLTLTDYEKLYKNGLMSIDDVLARMQGEYTNEDIQLERLGLLAGVF